MRTSRQSRREWDVDEESYNGGLIVRVEPVDNTSHVDRLNCNNKRVLFRWPLDRFIPIDTRLS